MQLRRLQPYLLSLTLVLLVVPLQAHAEGWVDSLLSGLNNALMNVAYMIVINALGLLVWFAASLLDFGVNTFVIGFGNTFAYTGIGIAVDQTWVIIRDFVNMFFIFGFVYIGFKMILNSSDSNTRRWLVNILLAALLVNFSLFVTKFTIDMSNQLAAQIAVNGLTDGTNISVRQPDGSELRQIDLTSSFMARMGISSVYGLNFDTVRGAGWGYVFGTAILFLTAAFVFAAGGILLIIRFAMLNIFMMLSPVMFMSWILPPLKDTMDRFWSQFIGKALFAPIYLMFIYFSLQVISGLQVSVGRGDNTFSKPDWQGTFQAIETGAKGGSSTSSMLGTLPFFILICVFLALSLIIADKLGMEGGSKAVSLGKSFANRVRKTAVNNSAGFAMRGVNRLSESAQGGYERLDARISSMSGLSGKLARGARGTLNIATMGATSDRALQGAFAAGRGARIDGSETSSEVDKRETERSSRQRAALEGIAIQDGIKENDRRKAEEERRIAAGAAAGSVEVNRNGVRQFVNENQLTAEERAARKKQDDSIAKMQRLAADMNIKQFEDMSESEQEALAEFMSGSLTESAMKSDKISDAQKEKIGAKQRETILKSITDENGAIISENLNNLSIRQIETLGDEFVSQNAALFNDSLFSDIKKSKKFTESQVGRYVGKRKTDLSAIVNNPTTAHQAFTQTHRDPTNGTVQRKARKSAEIAKLPGDVLANPNSVQYLTVDVLKAIASGDKEFERVSTQQREDIARMIKFENDRFLGANPQFKRAADYLKSPKGQESFFGN